MKKTKIILGLLTLIISATIIFACNKEKEEKTISKKDSTSAYLREFLKKMQSASKGNEVLSFDDARWHLEAVLNYSFGDAGYQTTDVMRDTFYNKLQANSNGVDIAQLNDAFNSISDSINTSFGFCDLQNKSILAVSIVFENDTKDSGLVVRTILNTRGFSTVNMWFDSTDYWNECYEELFGFVSSGGKCGPYEGDCPDSGAPKELTKKLNLRIPTLGYGNGVVFYTDLEDGYLSVYDIDYDQDFLYDPNSPCHYKLYYRNESPSEPWANNPSRCIHPDDMNYYLSKGLELINHNQPFGKICVDVFYESANIVGLKEDNCFHRMYLQYGIPHFNTGDDD